MSLTAPALKADGTKASQGRRTRLTYDAIEIITERVRAGQPVSDVIAAVCRVRPDTVQHWLQVGRGEHPKYPNPHARYIELVRAVEEAESAWVAETVGRWTADAKVHHKLQLAAVAAKRSEYKDQPVEARGESPIASVAKALAAAVLARELPAPVIIEGEHDAIQGPGEAEGSEQGANEAR